MNIYNGLINNLEILELFRFKENIGSYLDMIASREKTGSMSMLWVYGVPHNS